MTKKDYVILLDVIVLAACGMCLIVGIAADSTISLLYALFLGVIYAALGIISLCLSFKEPKHCDSRPMPLIPTNTVSYIGKSVQELQEFVTVISITRNGRYITPTLDTVIQPDDIIILRV